LQAHDFGLHRAGGNPRSERKEPCRRAKPHSCLRA
jgi:hypothetical protein